MMQTWDFFQMKFMCHMWNESVLNDFTKHFVLIYIPFFRKFLCQIYVCIMFTFQSIIEKYQNFWPNLYKILIFIFGIFLESNLFKYNISVILHKNLFEIITTKLIEQRQKSKSNKLFLRLRLKHIFSGYILKCKKFKIKQKLQTNI